MNLISIWTTYILRAMVETVFACTFTGQETEAEFCAKLDDMCRELFPRLEN